MANSDWCVFLAICATLLALRADAGALGLEMTWMPSMEEEFLMDTEVTRRILATSKCISYGALQRNTVSCSRRGASYYNRGCSGITRCRI